MSTALVTGAFGFLGRHLAHMLACLGHNVVGMGHGSWGRGEWERWGIASWHTCDITLENLLTFGGEPELIFHCAGSGSVAFSFSHPYQDYERSVATTLSVLEFSRLHVPRARVVLPSSAGIYGNSAAIPIAERAAADPLSPYGLHKRIAEDLLISYSRHFGTQSAIVRFFSLYGPELRKQLLWDACQKISAGDYLFWGTGQEIRDWLHVEDAGRLLLAASHHADDSAPIANGATGVGTSVRVVLQEVMKSFAIAAEPQFRGEERRGDPSVYVADISRARAWGWEPQWQIEGGVQQYVRWFKESIR